MLFAEELDNSGTEEFLREMKIMRKFKHPNIMRLLGITVHEGRPCLVMPLMVASLKQYLNKNKLVSIQNIFSTGNPISFIAHSKPKFLHRCCQKTISSILHWQLHKAWNI